MVTPPTEYRRDNHDHDERTRTGQTMNVCIQCAMLVISEVPHGNNRKNRGEGGGNSKVGSEFSDHVLVAIYKCCDISDGGRRSNHTCKFTGPVRGAVEEWVGWGEAAGGRIPGDRSARAGRLGDFLEACVTGDTDTVADSCEAVTCDSAVSFSPSSSTSVQVLPCPSAVVKINIHPNSQTFTQLRKR